MSAQIILQGDCREVMARMAPASVEMIYSDPPFGNEQVWTGKAGTFSDKWRDTAESEAGWDALRCHCAAGEELMAIVAKQSNLRPYLGTMAALLLGARRVLKPTGTIWLHFDDTAGAELQILGDVIFGPENHFGHVIWHRSTGRATRRGFARVHDTIACWGRTRAARWRLARARDAEFVNGDPAIGTLRVAGFADDRLNAQSTERVHYPTQKPLSLIERVIRSGSLPGDTILDPTCGSGTTLVAARNIGRRSIGIDQSADAISTARNRLGEGRTLLDLMEAA